MKKEFNIKVFLTILFTVLCLIPTGSFAKERKILLKTPLCFPTYLPGVNVTAKWLGDNLHKASNNTLKMKLYEPGKLIAPFEILSAVSKGKVDAGFSISGYWEGKIPGASIFSSVPFGPEAGEFLAWIYYGNGRKLYQKMYDDAGFNVHVIPCGIFSPESAGWYKKEINNVNDFKGMKIRFYGLGGKVLQKLGASVSLLPSSEIFPALEKNAIDGTEFSMPAIDKLLGFHKIAKNNYFPGWHQQATLFELLINKKKWNKMSERQKFLLEVMCKAATADCLAYTESIQAKAMRESRDKHGVKIKYLSADILKALKSAWDEVAKDLSKKSPMFKNAYQDLNNFRNNYDLWEKNAFLPRNKF